MISTRLNVLQAQHFSSNIKNHMQQLRLTLLYVQYEKNYVSYTNTKKETSDFMLSGSLCQLTSLKVLLDNHTECRFSVMLLSKMTSTILCEQFCSSQNKICLSYNFIFSTYPVWGLYDSPQDFSLLCSFCRGRIFFMCIRKNQSKAHEIWGLHRPDLWTKTNY